MNNWIKFYGELLKDHNKSMGHGLHSIEEKNAKASFLRPNNTVAAAARSQRLKQNHEKETTATRTTAEMTRNFFPS